MPFYDADTPDALPRYCLRLLPMPLVADAPAIALRRHAAHTPC